METAESGDGRITLMKIIFLLNHKSNFPPMAPSRSHEARKRQPTLKGQPRGNQKPEGSLEEAGAKYEFSG